MGIFASDDFTDSNGTTLQSHDANWVRAGGAADAQIQDNQLNNPPSGQDSAYYYNAAPSSADYTVSATVKNHGGTTRYIGVTARHASDGSAFYLVHTSNTALQMYRFNGSWSLLGTSSATFANDDVISIDVSGSTIRALINGSVTGCPSVTNSDITAAGYPGYRGDDVGGDPRLDDWYAEEAGGGATVTLSDLTYNARTTASITPRLDITYS